jgi:energy-coupling factor transport system substrate-specific component
MKSFTEHFKSEIQSIDIFELVLTMVLAVAIGVAFWGWTFVYEMVKPFLKLAGLNYLVAGFWIFASVFLSKIIQKPTIAIVASIVAAFVESLLTHWGMMTLVWGLVQGLGSEIVFLYFGYKRWDLKVLILASSLSTVFSYLLDYFIYDYRSLSGTLVIVQITTYIISSAILAGYLSEVVSIRLLKLGILDQFKIAKN